MAELALAYFGGSMPEGEAEQQAAMTRWMKWFGELGAAVVDGGNPFCGSKRIEPDGTIGGDRADGLTGCSLLEAASLVEATTMAMGWPVLTNGGSVEVHEALPVG